jgi:hypothetical protein
VSRVAASGLKKALAAASLVLGRAADVDQSVTLKRIRSKAVDVVHHRLVDQVTPAFAPPTAASAQARR